MEIGFANKKYRKNECKKKEGERDREFGKKEKGELTLRNRFHRKLNISPLLPISELAKNKTN